MLEKPEEIRVVILANGDGKRGKRRELRELQPRERNGLTCIFYLQPECAAPSLLETQLALPALGLWRPVTGFASL
jgi:hypothetical protein